MVVSSFSCSGISTRDLNPIYNVPMLGTHKTLLDNRWGGFVLGASSSLEVFPVIDAPPRPICARALTLLWLFFGQGINWFFAIIFDHQIALVFRFFSKVVHRVLIREWVLKLVGESGSCGQLLSVVLVVGCRMGHWRPGWRGRRVR
jgi:hypothetical protein